MVIPPVFPSCGTISDFLAIMHDQYWVFDMGCRLSPLSKSTLLAFEQCQQAYPHPWLKHAWVGFVITYTKTTRAWFLKFPLDEQGMLIQASRDEFLQQLLMTLSHSSQAADKHNAITQDLDIHLKHSPLAFTPDESYMAAFHARANTLLKQPASSHFAAFIAYLNSDDLNQGWHTLGLQGLADFATYLTSDNPYSQLLIKCWPNIPLTVGVQLALQCEHIVLHHTVASLFLQYGKHLVQLSNQANKRTHDTMACLPFLRAISQAKAARSRQQWIIDLLKQDAKNKVELLALVASKCQHDLKHNTQVLGHFLQAASYQQQVFNGLVGELMYQPCHRQSILNAVRQPDRDPQIAQAFGQMLR